MSQSMLQRLYYIFIRKQSLKPRNTQNQVCCIEAHTSEKEQQHSMDLHNVTKLCVAFFISKKGARAQQVSDEMQVVDFLFSLT